MPMLAAEVVLNHFKNEIIFQCVDIFELRETVWETRKDHDFERKLTHPRRQIRLLSINDGKSDHFRKEERI